MAVRASWIQSDWVKARLYHLTAPLVALAIVALVWRTPPAQSLEYLTVDLRFQARAPFDPPADPRLVFVGIDQQSLDNLGAWPWPRNIEADFLKTIVSSGINPHTVAFDLLFSDDYDKFNNLQSKGGVSYDEVLGDAAGLLPSVITGALSIAPVDKPDQQAAAESRTRTEFAQPSETVPLPNVRGDIHKISGSTVAAIPVRPIRKQSLFGFVDDDPSPIDGIRHVIPLVVRVGGQVYPSLALQTLSQMLNVDADKVEVDLPALVVRLKNSSGKSWTIPINEKGQYAINYRAENKFRGTSLFRLFSDLEMHAKAVDASTRNGTPVPPINPEADIGNKTLLIGQVATGLTDLGPTPLQAESPLAYTHLNVLNNILKGDYLRFVPEYWVVLGWALITWTTLLRLKDAPLVEAVLVPIWLVILYIAFAFGIFWLWSAQIALAWPVLSYAAVNFGGVVLRWREEQQGREQVKQVFSRMLSPEIMDHLLDHTENLEMGGSERPVTILFSDIRDYTKFSEGLKPAEVVRQLNVYFERMVACVQESRGTLHKYIGDAIMAAWGDIADASLGAKMDAQNAVRSALLMRRRLRELNEERKVAGLTPLRIGIGLNHGTDVLVGLIGASSRSEFTVMGDAVNTASRLEGMTKEFRTDLAISESVRLLLGDDFLVRRLGLIQLKGKTETTVVYEVLAEKTNVSESRLKPEVVAGYEKAFDDFLARRFNQAKAGFLAFQKLYPDDYCVQRYLEAVSDFSALPPPPHWDGRIVMETK